MDTKNDPTSCESRVDGELANRLAEFFPDVTGWSLLKCARRLKEEGRKLDTPDAGRAREQVLDVIRERAREDLLSVEEIITYRLCLSWGGPSEYFELNWSPDGREWRGGRYILHGWFEGASRQLTDEQVEQVAELFGILPPDSTDVNRR